jgi:hypothetical protein
MLYSNSSYFAPHIMSNSSINLSAESPANEVTTWDVTPALPIPPPQELDKNAFRSVALTPPISPHSALALLDGHDNISTNTLRAIARGLTVTLQQRDMYYAQQCHRHEQQIKNLQNKVLEYEKTFNSIPEGYEENNSYLPNFNILVGNSMYRPAKYIKQLEGGWVAGYSEEDGPSSMPHIIKIFVTPAYAHVDPIPSNEDPTKPMPAWFHKLLCGHTALYSHLQKAILDLSDWGPFANITRHHSLDIELSTLLRQMERLRLDIDNRRTAKEMCEACLTMANAFAKVNHLDMYTRPQQHKTDTWSKQPRNERGHPF